MSTFPGITALSVRAPLYQEIVNLGGSGGIGNDGKPTDVEVKWRTNLMAILASMATVNVKQWGARGDGKSDDTAAFQQAINQVISQGGGIVYIPNGDFRVGMLSVPADAPPITLMGQGMATILRRIGVLAPKTGMLDVSSSNFSLSNLVIDGNTTVPVGLQYNQSFNGINGNDPMAQSLTQNTSVWLHGPAQKFSCFRVMFTHTAGYAILLDAMTGVIDDVDIISCWFQNNRPTLFGITPGSLIYGSWNGGIFAKGDGRTATSGIVRNLFVSGCHFERNTGNQIWSHLYSLTRLNENFRITDCFFRDIGLDGILVGGVIGGVVSGNAFRRIGYVTLTDTDAPAPRWLPGLNATALDSGGVVLNVPYVSNSFLNVNGGFIDADGHGQSVIGGSIMRISSPGDPEYADDSIATSGVNGNGSTSYGFNMGNSQQVPQGAANVEIVGNTFVGVPDGSLRLYAARYCHAHGNTIIAPDASTRPPIVMGPLGVGASQRCYGNRIHGNHIVYSPASSKPAIFEDNQVTPFTGGESNLVYDNVPVLGNGSAYEFLPDAASASSVSTFFPPKQNFVGVENGANNAIACDAGSGAALSRGLVISIKLAHTLQAGANTLAYNGGAAVAIKSHRNPANDIAVAYVVGAVIMLQFDGAAWQDLSQ